VERALGEAQDGLCDAVSDFLPVSSRSLKTAPDDDGGGALFRALRLVGTVARGLPETLRRR
jgi:hypothetical protein